MSIKFTGSFERMLLRDIEKVLLLNIVKVLLHDAIFLSTCNKSTAYN